MHKSDLVNHIAEQAGITKKQARAAYDAFTEGVMTSVEKGEDVTLIGFGTFRAAERSKREGRNPQTGKKIIIKAHKVPAFRPGKAFKGLLRK